MRDMTRGSIPRHIIGYVVPMILGNLLQLTYNAADSVIISKFLGENALAAVATAGPVMTVMTLGASGIGIGAGVLMSRFYGSRDTQKLKKEFAMTLLMGVILELLVFALGFPFAKAILRLIKTPETVLNEAALYLRVILVGFLFSFQYNVLSHSMRALGETKRPVYYLSASCILNIGLDYLLVGVMGAGVAGAAAATAVSQALSMVLCVIGIKKRIPLLSVKREDFTPDKALLKATASNGLLTALQQAAQPVGKLLIQSTVNSLGTSAMAAFNAVSRVDDFACIPAQSLGSGIMTATAQNRGAGDEQRTMDSIKKGLLLALCWFPIICSAILLFKKPVIALLTPDDAEVCRAMALSHLSVKAWLYFLPCITNAIQGYFRGRGKMTTVLIATCTQISIRALLVVLFMPKYGIVVEAWAAAVGWVAMIAYEGVLMALKKDGRK